MNKFLLFVAIITISAGMCRAQNSFVLGGAVTGSPVIILRSLSPDGTKAVGFAGATASALNGSAVWWNVDASAPSVIGSVPSGGWGVNNLGIVAGSFPDPQIQYPAGSGTYLSSGGYYQNGVWTGIGLGIATAPYNEYSGSAVNALSADGNILAGHAVVQDASLGAQLVYPYSWTKNGSSWTGQIWAMPNNVLYGANANIDDISSDGTVASGWVHFDGGAARAPVYWTSPTEYHLFSSDIYTDAGDAVAVSPNGKYIVYILNGQVGVLDVSTGTRQIVGTGADLVPNGISDNATVVGSYNSTAYTNTKKGFIWTPNLGYMDFGNFLSAYDDALYATIPTAAKNAFNASQRGDAVPAAVSADGTTIVGWVAAGVRGSSVPFALKLTSPISALSYPKNLKVNVPVATRNKAILTWDAPNAENVPVTAYQIYRDDTLIATTADASTFTYTDMNVPAGYHEYGVQAVYGNKTSRISDLVEAVIVNNYNLPFHEGFDSVSLKTNYWTTTIDTGFVFLWTPSLGAGVEGSAGIFTEIPTTDVFSTSLISKPFDATGANKVYVSYATLGQYIDIREGFSVDTMYLDVYDGTKWTEAYSTIYKASTLADWVTPLVDISDLAAGKLFNIRLRLQGKNLSIDHKWYYLDNIDVMLVEPDGAAPRDIMYKNTENDSAQFVWKDPSGVYGLSYTVGPNREIYTNQGVPFIAVQDFDSSALGIYQNYYLTSISAYIGKIDSISGDSATSLNLAVFQDGLRIANQPIYSFQPYAWNTFQLNTPVLISKYMSDLKFGIEAVAYAFSEAPIGVDEEGRGVAGKGDVYSIDGGLTWLTLTGRGQADLNRNWSIIGNVSLDGMIGRTPNILGYNLYRDGVKINNDLIYGQSFVTDKIYGTYTTRAYSLETGISGASNPLQLLPLITPQIDGNKNVFAYPNPVRSTLYIHANSDIVSAAIYSLSGALVRYLATPQSKIIDVQNLASGIYIIKIVTKEGTASQKIIKR